MPAPKSPEFRQRAVELARERAKPIAQIAKDLGVSESCLRRWLEQVPGADHLLEDCWVTLAQLAIADPSHWPDHLDQPARDRHGPTA